ncbi:MAG TPA: hypothetical protein VGA70_07870 [Longimicrobiales bacterium]|jgi:hypothetical protein
MPRIDFDALPDDARLWVFGASRPLHAEQADLLLAEVDAFLGGWAAHGSPLTCARDWRHGRFLLVAVDERSVPPSGCSIDAMVRVLKELEARLNASLVDNAPVWYRDGKGVVQASRSEFSRLARDGLVGPGTVVFDGTVTRVADVRAGAWEAPARDTWHGKAFFGS